MQKKLYVLISNDLDPIYECVQGGHAVAQWLLDNKDSQTWNNQYLIYLIADVKKWEFKLNSMGISHSCFYEPDLNNVLTAIAVEAPSEIFKKLQPIKF
jgi:hypothetical protein